MNNIVSDCNCKFENTRSRKIKNLPGSKEIILVDNN